MGLNATTKIQSGYTHIVGALTGSAKFGGGGEPSGSLVLTDGTGSGQANQVFSANFTIAATTMQLYDLKGGNGELDVLNRAMAMAAVKEIYIELAAPGASVSIRFGPQNQTNAMQLWFQAATANFYDTVLDKFFHCDARAGWALDATHKVLALYNPGAAPVSGYLRVKGNM